MALKWSQTAYTSTGYAAPTDAQVIAALDTATATLTQWRKISSTVDYVELGGPIGSKLEDFRAIISVNPATSGVFNAGVVSSYAIFVGIAPDGGTVEDWQTAEVYGAGVRWSKYDCCAKTRVVESLYFIESEEVLGVMFHDDSINQHYGTFFGNLVDPVKGPSEDGIVYGITSSGRNAISTGLWGSCGFFPGGGSNSNNYQKTRIFAPDDPTTLQTTLRIQAGGGSATAKLTHSNSLPKTKVPIHLSTNTTPYRYIGKLRQMYVSDIGMNRTEVVDGGITVSTSNVSEYAAFFLANL